MKTATVSIEGLSPLSMSRFHGIAKNEKESDDAWRDRTWREHCHYDAKTREVYLPPMMLKNSLARAAKYAGDRIAGKGQKTWGPKFLASVLVLEGAKLGVKVEDVQSERLFLPSDGVAGSGKRVMKCYPVIYEWSAKATYTILDDTITEDIFEKYLRECGNFIGLGRFRPERGGYYGRFSVNSLKWN